MDPLAIYILRGLHSAGKIGNKYTNIRTLIHYLPKRYRDRTLINKLIKNLRKKDFIILHKKNTTISLNPHKLPEIEKIIFSSTDKKVF